jgi:hypothetical protein
LPDDPIRGHPEFKEVSKMGMRIAKLFLFLIVSAAIAVPALEAQESTFLVVPGKALGQYELTWGLDQFVKEFGNPLRVLDLNTDTIDATTKQLGEPKMAIRSHLWTGYEVITRPDRDNRVIMISVHMVRDPEKNARNLKYRTAEGVGLGSKRADVENAYGRAEWEFRARNRIFLWYASGISFMMFDNNPDVIFLMGVWSLENWQR